MHHKYADKSIRRLAGTCYSLFFKMIYYCRIGLIYAKYVYIQMKRCTQEDFTMQHLIKQCVDLHGRMSAGNSALLTALCQSPSPELWSQAQRMIICDRPLTTLRSAVNGVTGGRISYKGAPDEFTLYRALRHAIDKRRRFKANPELPFSES